MLFAQFRVGIVPRDCAIGCHFGTDFPVRFHVVMVPAEALEIAKCGPAASVEGNDMVDVALCSGGGASWIAAVPVALPSGEFLFGGGGVNAPAQECDFKDIAIALWDLLECLLITKFAGAFEFIYYQRCVRLERSKTKDGDGCGFAVSAHKFTQGVDSADVVGVCVGGEMPVNRLGGDLVDFRGEQPHSLRGAWGDPVAWRCGFRRADDQRVLETCSNEADEGPGAGEVLVGNFRGEFSNKRLLQRRNQVVTRAGG